MQEVIAQRKGLFLWTLGKKIINSCVTEKQLETARKWVYQVGTFNPDLAVSLSYELSEREHYLKYIQ